MPDTDINSGKSSPSSWLTTDALDWIGTPSNMQASSSIAPHPCPPSFFTSCSLPFKDSFDPSLLDTEINTCGSKGADITLFDPSVLF